MDTRARHTPTHGIAVGLIGTVLTLGTPQDITLQELRVEMFMPADEASEATLVQLGR
jgi:MmyB-like transcription regulator ligand binding domain